MDSSILFHYSFPQLLAAYTAYKQQTKEGFNGRSDTILGLAAGTFFALLIISLVIWIVALVLLFQHAHEMPTWALVVAIVSMFLFAVGPIIAIVLALMVRK